MAVALEIGRAGGADDAVSNDRKMHDGARFHVPAVDIKRRGRVAALRNAICCRAVEING
jgi:hypothetical protein